MMNFICTDGNEHSIGHNAVDSGHGARPMGPQICLKCRKTLNDLIKQSNLDLLKRLEEQAKVQNGRALNGEITKDWFIDTSAITRERKRIERGEG